MALDIIQPMRFEIDIKSGLVQRPQRTQLMKGDKNANRIIVALVDDGKEVDLTGATVTGSFISPVEEAKIPLTGSVNGNEASVTLVEECYAEDGWYQLDVELTVGETRRTIASMTGYVLRKGSGAVIDIGGVIPSIDDIIAQYATMKQVTQETQTAADNANAARDGANEAKENANAAAEAANHAAAQGPYVGENGNWWIYYSHSDAYVDSGVPATGDTGLTPQITFEVSTGAAGTDVQLEQSGTAEAPIVHLTIPRGDTGSIDGIDYYEGTPEALGTASPGDANGVARGDHVHPVPEIRKLYDRNGNNYAEITVSDNDVVIYDSIHGSRLYFNTNSGLVTVYDAEDNVLNSLYGTGNKPTAAEVGALPDYGRGKVLWSGSWSEGTITVPGTDRYTVYQIITADQDTTILAARNGKYIRGIGGYSSGTPTVMTTHFNATLDEDVWTFVVCNRFAHRQVESSDGSWHSTLADHAVTSIVGLC